MKVLSWLLCWVLTSCVKGAWECNSTVSPVNYVAFPSLYNNVLVLRPDGINCHLFRNTFFQCHYTTILGDGMVVSSPPNLDSNTYLRGFLAWEKRATAPYLDFDLTGLTIPLTAIQLTFLNSPANEISLPDVELFTVVYGSSFATDSTNIVPSRLLDNQDLAASDNQVRTVTIAPLLPLSSLHIRINFTFTDLHSFNWLLVNEVMFCDSPQSLPEASVTFIPHQSLTVQPSGAELMGGAIQLTCMLSSQGRYSWQWKRDNETLTGDQSHSVRVGDGTRTTILTLILDLTFASAGAYSCVATTIDGANTQIVDTLTQELNFPECIESDPMVSGEEEVTLVCQVHGYLTTLLPPLWVDSRGNLLTNSSRVTVGTSEGSKSIVLANGATVPSIVVTVTIRNLSLADEGNYTCKGDRGRSVTLVTVVILPPPTTHPPTTHPPTTQPPTTQPPTTQPPSMPPLTTQYYTTMDNEFTSPTLVNSEATTPPLTTTPPHSPLPVPVIVVIGVVGGLVLLCVLIVLPPLIVYAILRVRYRQEKAVLQQTRHQPAADRDSPLSPKAVVIENPVFKYTNQTGKTGRFEQSEIFSYYKDL